MAQSEKSERSNEYVYIMGAVMNFLKHFMPETLVKRILSIVLICAGLENSRVTELTGYCDRSVRGLRKRIERGDITGLFTVGGGGRKRKTAEFENAILAELEKGNYHTRQQIADMIEEKFHFSISPSAVGKFLKKTGTGV